MKAFFRYWSWGMAGAICLSMSLSLFVRYLDQEEATEAVMIQSKEQSWVSFVLSISKRWKIEQINKEQDVLWIEMKEEETQNWETAAKNMITESFDNFPDLQTIRLRMNHTHQEATELFYVKRSIWLDLVKKSEWSKQSLQKFNLSNGEKTTD